MPFLDPFKPVFWNIFPVVKAYIGSHVKIVREFMRLMVIEFFVFIMVLVTERGEITQYSRSRWETAGTLSVKELLVRKSTLNYNTVVLISYKG